MENTGSSIESLIATITPQVQKDLEREFSKRVAEHMSWSLQNKIGEFVSDYIKTNVLPEVEKQLSQNKAVIAASICAAVEQSCAALGEKLKETAIKQIANAWSTKQIAKELFGH